MNLKSYKINNKILIKLLFGFIAVAIAVYLLVTFVMYMSALDSKEKYFHNKLEIVSDLFISSYTSVYKTTFDEKMSFDIASKLVEKLDNIRFIRVWSDELNVIQHNYVGENEFVVDRNDIMDGTFKTVNISKKNYLKIVRSFRIDNQRERFIELFSSIEDVEKITLDAIMQTALIAALVIILFFPLFFLFSKKLLFPINQISVEIQKIKNYPPSQWRQLKQHADNLFLNEIIISVNELIFRAQRSLVCQENLGRFLAHEIKAPLTNLLNEIELTRREVANNNVAKEKNDIFCAQAVTDILRIRSIVNNICGLAYIDSMVHFEENVDLKKLLKSTIKEFQHVYKHEVQFEDNIQSEQALVSLNTDYFWILSSNILRNSIEHGKGHETPPKIHLSIKGDWIEIAFSDSGPGFPYSRKFLEDMKNENNLDQLLHSHGAGLMLCLKLSEIMNIDINFSNQISGGAVVTLAFEKQKATV